LVQLLARTVAYRDAQLLCALGQLQHAGVALAVLHQQLTHALGIVAQCALDGIDADDPALTHGLPFGFGLRPPCFFGAGGGVATSASLRPNARPIALAARPNMPGALVVAAAFFGSE